MLSAYHNWSVSDSVFRYDDLIFVLLPLWRLVLHVSDGDCQLDWTALIPSICSDDLPADVGPLETIKRNYWGVKNNLRQKILKCTKTKVFKLEPRVKYLNIKQRKKTAFTKYFRNVKFGMLAQVDKYVLTKLTHLKNLIILMLQRVYKNKNLINCSYFILIFNRILIHLQMCTHTIL